MSFITRLKLQRPNFKYLKEDGFNCVDMHIHSCYSDGARKIGPILKKAKKNGFGISITDHNEIKGSIEAIKDSKGVMVIPGMEINSSDGPDILVYFYNVHEMAEFYNKHIKKYKGVDPYGRSKVSLIMLSERLKRYNCIISAAHPCGPAWKNLKKHLKKENSSQKKILGMLDAIEVVNSEMTRKMNVNAILWNLLLDKSITGGSDGHTLSEVGAAVTYSKAEKVGEFLDNIKKHKSYVTGTENKLRKKIISTSNNFRKHMRYIRPNLSMGLKYELNSVLRPFLKKEFGKLKNGDFSRILNDNRIAQRVKKTLNKSKKYRNFKEKRDAEKKIIRHKKSKKNKKN